MAASGRSSAFKVMQLLASLTSIATCLFVVARMGPQPGGRWPILAESGLRRLVTLAPSWSGGSAADAMADAALTAGSRPHPAGLAAAASAAPAHGLQDCLEAARQGHWHRVLNVS